ncbi:MAG: biotin--[acetyl-CoA-carboxylase] ligase [Wolbachia sp.]|nr:biotin--[acetyl-CoA-carboxylase] ligase [Wolbachia sp.]MDD9336250.1 biotin--[acetyl-CoA-carboxylase] ligase [Wolbachia sp.]
MTLETFEGFHIHHYKEVLSTNTEALDLIDKGISNETVIIADMQTSGKGRTGKSWISPKGNFCASLIVNLSQISSLDFSAGYLDNRLDVTAHFGVIPACDAGIYLVQSTEMIESIDISRFTDLTFITALAVGNTLLSFMNGSNIQYKWPNDVIIDGKKISGILLERKSNSNLLVIGIGINIISAPLPGTTCISDYSEPMYNVGLLKELIINFNKLREQWLSSGFYAIKEMWLKRAFKLNEHISIKLANKLYEGIFTDIDKDGKLVLQQKNSSLIYFDAGELFI